MRHIKTMLGWLLCHAGLFRRLLSGKAVVILFHRVNPALKGNPISCTPEEFERYCRFLKRYFTVVPFSELIARLRRGEEVSGLACINFDDGYRDNFEHAAPVLEALGLPACFFIATDFIGSDIIPWWDRDRGIRTEWMSWDQVRALRQKGFEIGAHTRTHIDLGVVHGDEALSEIVGSRQRLEQELGESIELFSYPFGRSTQLSEENRALVQSLGFVCCPSAYGGLVASGDDPFRMQRQPISPWHLSPWQLAFELVVESREVRAH